jgi:WD40 repeat protein
LGIRLTGREQGMAAKRPVLAVAVAATVVIIGVLAFRGSGSDSPVVTQAGGKSPAVPPPGAGDGVNTTLASAGRPAANAARPAEIAAIVGGSVVLLDGRDGHTLRTLATHPEATTGGFPYLQAVSLSPDRSQVFYSLVGDCGPATIYQVPADSHSAPVGILTGVSPAVSPDGRKLAYAVAAAGAAERHCQNAVVVRDLQTGAERTWRYPDTPDYATSLYQDAVISEIDWAPDSTRLAYTLSYEGDSVSVLDTETDADLGHTDEVVIPDGGGNSNHPAWQAGSGLLGIFNTRFECCFDDNYTGPPRALLVDVDRRLGTPLLPAGRRVTALDFDASGAHLLFVDGGRLYRRTGVQTPVGLVSGVTAADW